MSASATTEMDADAYRHPADAVVAALGSDAGRGLTTAEASDRRRRHGPNELPSAPPVPAWRRVLAQFRSPLTILLLVATAISFLAWLIERESAVPFETLTILAIVVLNAVLGVVQEGRAEQAVAALRAMSAPTARVLRDGGQRTIPAADLVPGDVLVLEEGDTVPADGRVLESIALRTAEASLTGESAPASKRSGPIDEEAGLGDRRNMVFGGTAVAAGRGRAVATATGPRTEMGRIAGSLAQTGGEATPLQRELDRVGRLLGVGVVALAVVVGATILLVSDVGSLSDAVDVLLLAVSLAVAAVPEGLTAITTIVLSLGMQRMARRNVLVRRLTAVETLGSTTVICTDKTGTLTRNEMTVRAVVTATGRVDLTGTGYAPEGDARHGDRPLGDPDLRQELEYALRAGALASNAELRLQDGRWTVLGDPTEGALLVAARKIGLGEADLAGRFHRVGEVPFTSERKLMSTALDDDAEAGRTVVAAKGAPDVLLGRCTHERVGARARALTPERRRAIEATIDDLAAAALRTLGVASRVLPTPVVDGAFDEEAERDLVFLGVVGMIDPPRPEAAESVRVARRAGVRAIMITGDHPSTAAAIAAEIGIAPPGERAVSGPELERSDDAALRGLVRERSVYARVAPEHKLRIVRALKAEGAVVAMTGDGVNDAPALKAADIGVAMGITGTDVAKGAADMILADDNFASIVAAVEEGRSIFANIQKFLRYLLSSNVGEVLVMFVGVVAAGVIGLLPGEGSVVAAPLLATQILWINLLTDSAPALALGVEPDDPALMARPPRDPGGPVLTPAMWFGIVFVGVVMAAGTLLVLDWALPGGLVPGGTRTLPEARTLAFTTLVFAQLFNVFNARSDVQSALRGLTTNRQLWLAVLLSVLLQVAVVYVPVLQRAFDTVPLDLADWLVCVGVASSVLWLRELSKLVVRRRSLAPAPS